MPNDLYSKLQDATIPGAQIDMDPDEAEAAGAFDESAVSDADALAATSDMLEPEDQRHE